MHLGFQLGYPAVAAVTDGCGALDAVGWRKDADRWRWRMKSTVESPVLWLGSVLSAALRCAVRWCPVLWLGSVPSLCLVIWGECLGFMPWICAFGLCLEGHCLAARTQAGWTRCNLRRRWGWGWGWRRFGAGIGAAL